MVKFVLQLRFGGIFGFTSHVTTGVNRPAGVERPIFSPSDPDRG